MIKQLEICDESELNLVSSAILDFVYKGRSIVLLNGELGAGKTALVKNFVQFIGIDYPASSPTFSIVNEYTSEEHRVFHFDLYRLASMEEIEEIGFWDYVDQNAICFIEWPDKIADILPIEKVINVQIYVNLNQCRSFSLSLF